jgi:hypothetical protein
MVAHMSNSTIRLRDTATGAVDFSQRYEFIDSKELALRWNLPESWIREQVRKRSTDPLPPHSIYQIRPFSLGQPRTRRLG